MKALRGQWRVHFLLQVHFPRSFNKHLLSVHYVSALCQGSGSCSLELHSLMGEKGL